MASHLKELIKNKDSLTDNQIQSVKAALNNIKRDRQALEGMLGDITRILPDLRTAKQSRNLNEAQTALNSIIDVQNTRMTELKKIIDDLNKVASM